MTDISVIIPTYNRNSVLKLTLAALGLQSVSKNSFEVIVIDDGSSKSELALLTSLIKAQKFYVKLLFQKHHGPAAARNKGIKSAKGKIVLIINDDSVPHKDLLKKHLLFHQKFVSENYGLLGRVTWHPEIKVTPFMSWLENGGPYFSFNSIIGKNAGWERLWTCNVSFKRHFLLNHGLFDESFPDAAWEDVELGYRLSLAGLVLRYSRSALGYHFHPTSVASIADKMHSNGRNLTLIREKIPAVYWPPLARHPRLFFFLDKVFCLDLLAKLTLIFPDYFDQLPFGYFFQNLVLFHFRISGLRERFY